MKRECCPRLRASRGFGSLIELVIVAAIILGAMAMYFSFSGGLLGGKNDAANELLNETNSSVSTDAPGSSETIAPRSTTTTTPGTPGMPAPRPQANVRVPTTIPGRAVYKAHGIECQNNIRQVRMLIDSAKAESPDGTPPASLGDIPGARGITVCPITKLPYQYDPATGRVWCDAPGHESY